MEAEDRVIGERVVAPTGECEVVALVRGRVPEAYRAAVAGAAIVSLVSMRSSMTTLSPGPDRIAGQRQAVT